MFFVISILILILCLILQASFLARWPIWGVIPDLNLIAVTCFSWIAGPMKGTGFAFIAGIMQDFMSLKSPGASSISKTCIGFLTGSGKGRSKSKYLMPLFFLLVNTIINEVIYLLFYFSLGTQKILPPDIISKMLLQILLKPSFCSCIFTNFQ